MSTDIQQAAISYFGLPEGAQLVEGGPMGCFAFVIPLTEEHMRGIADRMKALAEPVERVADDNYGIREELRPAYNALSDQERARLGSFWRYCQEAYAADPYEPAAYAPMPMKTKEELRSEYDGMTAAEKARFGSFGQYCAHAVMGTAQDDALMHGGEA